MTLDTDIVAILQATPGLSAAKISERLKARHPRGLARLLWTFAGSATLYPALLKLERHGIVTSRWGIQAGDRPRRRLYFLANPSSPTV
jgi:DNA-binding PadR family transcriptional regulator